MGFGTRQPTSNDSPKVWRTGERVYVRWMDLLGMITEVKERTVMVKFEWPWDPKAGPEEVDKRELSTPPFGV